MAFMPVRRDSATEAFSDGTARDEFLLVRDTQTGEVLDPRTDTSFDRPRFDHVPASGRGSVVSWSVPHARTPEGEATTVVGIVQLEEGPWWWAEIRGFAPDEDLENAAVTVAFENAGEERIPYFTRA